MVGLYRSQFLIHGTVKNMSNRITFEPTEFTNVRTGEVSRGYRAYDDYASTYSNGWESIPDDDLEFLAMVIEDGNEEATKLLNHCAEHERGVFIGPVFYGWEKIRELFSDSLHDVAAEEDRRDHKRGLYGPDPGEVR